MRRKVTAKLLHDMGVKSGPDLPLHPDSKIGLVKAQILSTLEKLYGEQMDVWRRVLKRAQQKPFFQHDPQKTAVQQLLAEIEALLPQAPKKRS